MAASAVTLESFHTLSAWSPRPEDRPVQPQHRPRATHCRDEPPFEATEHHLPVYVPEKR